MSTEAMAALERIARMLDPEAWDHAIATSPKHDIRRGVALKRAAKVMILFAPMLAKEDARIRETATQDLASDQEQIDAHERALARGGELKLVAEQDEKGVALNPDSARRICAAAIRAAE